MSPPRCGFSFAALLCAALLAWDASAQAAPATPTPAPFTPSPFAYAQTPAPADGGGRESSVVVIVVIVVLVLCCALCAGGLAWRRADCCQKLKAKPDDGGAADLTNVGSPTEKYAPGATIVVEDDDAIEQPRPRRVGDGTGDAALLRPAAAAAVAATPEWQRHGSMDVESLDSRPLTPASPGGRFPGAVNRSLDLDERMPPGAAAVPPGEATFGPDGRALPPRPIAGFEGTGGGTVVDLSDPHPHARYH